MAAAAATVVLAITLAACGDDDTTTRPQAAGTPRQGGELTLTLPGDSTSLDPFRTSYVNVADGSRMTALYDTLLWTDPATGSVRPQIAESLTTSESDSTRWTLKLRPNVKFTDGTPFDAEAVKFNWERHLDPKVQSFQYRSATIIQKITKRDDLTLDIRLVQKNANFDRLVARNLAYIVSPTAYQKDPAGFSEHPVGAGPFKLETWEKKKQQTYTRNPDYWQKEQNLPRLDRIKIAVETDVTATVDRIKKGESDITVVVSPTITADAVSKKLATSTLNLSGGQVFLFNTRVAPFNDVNARKAVAYALNGEEVNQRFYGGKGVAAKGLFSASSPLSNIQLAAGENDKAQATKLFDQVTANGTKPLNFKYVVPQSPVSEAVAKYMADQLNAYRGVHMEVQVVSLPDYVKIVRAGTTGWTSALYQLWIEDPEPLMYDLLHSKGSANNSGYENPLVDAELLKARQTTNTEERRTSYTKVQIELNKDMPFWVYQEATTSAIYNPDIAGLQLAGDGIVLWDRVGLSG